MTNVIDLPLSGHCNTNADIAAHLRELADQIEGLTTSPVDNIILLSVFADGGQVDIAIVGKPLERVQLAGLLALTLGAV
jgi:hypothetical protein